MTLNIPIPDQSVLDDRFSFIKDETLKTNTVITFRYIIFLITLEQKEKLPGPIIYSIYKDIIVQTGTVVESCIHYTLRVLIDTEIIKSSETMEEEWKDEKSIQIAKLENGKKVYGVIKHKVFKKLEKHTQFIDLNRACLRTEIFDQDVFRKAEKLREARNKIHLAGLNTVDDIYTKAEVNEYFEYAGMILKSLEAKLSHAT